MEIIAEQRLLEQHVLGGSLVYAGYHVWGFVPFFGGFSLFELNALLIHLLYFPVFIAVSFVSSLLIRKRWPDWSLAVHAGILFLLANVALGRIPLADSVPLADFPYANDLVYWLRWTLALSFLFFVNKFIERLPVAVKWVIAGFPLFVVAGVFGLLISDS